ncbi:hypothetical protein [Streptomyces ipomoeae]|uniref:hypothetical protein n=1 Tax=Streptomyces ipomoeae TaxID=103232 RepID=UPI001146BE30|nr:hypothetical protein [Streptomyces ipomoeae]TQE33116.1 hypothetical protein Sipo7851_21710 [Streptomyces ipomoeae]
MAEENKPPLPSGQQWGEGDPARPLYVPAEVKQLAEARAKAESRSLTSVIRFEGFVLYRYGHLEPVKPKRAPAGSLGGAKSVPPTSVRFPAVEWDRIMERCAADKLRLGFLVNPSRVATQFLRDVYLAAPAVQVPAEDTVPNRSVYIPESVKGRAGQRSKDEGRTLAAVIREGFTLYRHGHLEPVATVRAPAGSVDPEGGPLTTTVRVPTVEWQQITERCAADSERLGFAVNPSRIAAQFLGHVYLGDEESDAPAEE